MAKFALALTAVLLPDLGVGVNLRHAQVVGTLGVSDANHTISASSFSTAFVADVDAAINRLLPGIVIANGTYPTHAALVVKRANLSSGGSKASKRTSIADLAERGAAELDLETALRSSAIPADIKMLAEQKGKGAVDSETVEKAVVSLNGMIAKAQIRLDAKNDECAVFQIKSEQTLEQINSDLARMGQDLSNTARAISVHIGGISATNLHNQQTKEELEREEIAYNEVRTADLAVLEEREANLKVSEFILDFSKCADVPSALLQGRPMGSLLAGHGQLSTTGFQTCLNGTGGPTELNFADARLDNATKQLSPDGQQMLIRFALALESQAGQGFGVDVATASLAAAALGSANGLENDRRDGNGDEDEDGDDDIDDEKASAALLAVKGCTNSSCSPAPRVAPLPPQPPSPPPASQDCGPQVERQLIAKNKPCGKMPASCCSCNRWRTEVTGQADEADGWCHYVHSRRVGYPDKCKSGKWIRKNPAYPAEIICQKPAVAQAVVQPEASEVKSANRCSNAKFHCAVLHDLFAGLWGEMKDLVDSLTWKINADAAAWKKVQSDINTLFQTQATQLMSLQTALAEATASKAEATDEQTQKQKEKSSTTQLFDTTMADCSTVMREILFTEICGVIAVRNNMVKAHLKGEPVPVDCSVTEWVAADCSVPCDDQLQGGTHSLAREVITKNSQRGAACPALTTSRKCNQIKCPVNCDLSAFSSYGKCTKECGGGVQSRTRSVTVEPKNGGKACDALSETRPCNSGACDIDCELGEWMEFAVCTKSCNAGYAERRKRMLVEAEGMGKCLDPLDPNRLERKPCNTAACTGDEMCNSTTDIVLALDGSGSVTEEGFDIIKTFAEKIVRRMKSTVKVGVVQFGNGKLGKGRIISDAILATDDLESDMESVAGKIQKLVWQKGFTNMAQAFMKSKDVLTNARKDGKSVVVVLTDGRPSFKFQTTHTVKDLRKSSRLMIVHVKKHRKQEMAQLLKGYASEPWDANYFHIPGKHALKDAYDSFATQLIADICPKLVSPSAITACTNTDGSAPGEIPCECGSALCNPGDMCFADNHFCEAPKS